LQALNAWVEVEQGAGGTDEVLVFEVLVIGRDQAEGKNRVFISTQVLHQKLMRSILPALEVIVPDFLLNHFELEGGAEAGEQAEDQWQDQDAAIA
jgi:hypothetical protein